MKNKTYIIISSIIFAIFIVIGNSYQKVSSWNLVFNNWKTVGLSILQVIICC